ncbi:MAG: DNA-3-methyladenine glycosylase family protein, partial [Chloroflexota bacterium]
LAERYGRQLAYDGRVYFAFPTAEAFASAEEDELRQLGLSQRKAEVLRALAQRIIDGDPLLRDLDTLPTPEVVATLTTLPGIGRWSAEVILLRGFGRLDVFPSGDAGVDRGLAGILGRSEVPGKAEQSAILERFGAWRGMLYFLIAGYRLLGLHLDSPVDRTS